MSSKVSQIDLECLELHSLESIEPIIGFYPEKGELSDIFRGGFVRSGRRAWFRCAKYHNMPIPEQKMLKKLTSSWSFVALVSLNFSDSDTNRENLWATHSRFQKWDLFKNFYIMFRGSKICRVL